MKASCQHQLIVVFTNHKQILFYIYISGVLIKMTDTEEATASDKDNSKICILLNATGNVPIIKKRKWTVDPNKTISWIMKFIHQYLKLDPSEQIFLYVNQTFAPAPDQNIKNLYDCHGTNGKLVLYYCKNQAWG